MYLLKSMALGMLLSIAVTIAAPTDAATDVSADGNAEVPSPDISNGVGIITYSKSGCGGTNQGTTLDYGGNQCVNWSNAGSFRLQFGTLGGCKNGRVATVKFHHKLNCGGATYASRNFNGGCYNLNAVSGGHGSGLIIC